MAIKAFNRDEAGYEEWIKGHATSGFVLHLEPGRRPAFRFRLHRADCHHLAYYGGSKKWAYTDKTKMCSTDKAELLDHVKAAGSEIGPLCQWCAARGLTAD
jgi:hypothetical protein